MVASRSLSWKEMPGLQLFSPKSPTFHPDGSPPMLDVFAFTKSVDCDSFLFLEVLMILRFFRNFSVFLFGAAAKKNKSATKITF
jgi:hypothetical protein